MSAPVLYARNGELSIAYQVVGEGCRCPDDPGWLSHLALDWEEPTWVRWAERLASFEGRSTPSGPPADPSGSRRVRPSCTRGVHMDKVFERNGALGGIAVHLTARVMAKSTGGDVLVSEAVKDIVAGSALRFEDRGRDIEGHRRPYAVAPD